MAFRFLLLLFPALALARIDVEILGEFHGNDKTVNINYSGSDTSVISEEERNTFMLSEDTLKNSALNFFGNRPDNVYLRSPTPWGDLYKTYNWEEVSRTLKPKLGRILNVSAETQTIASQTFENKETKPTTFNVGLSKHLENTVSSFWIKDGELTINKGINYDIKFGNTTITYTSLWGLNTEKSMTTLIGLNNLEMVLQPGQSVTTELIVTKLTATLEMEYAAFLSGTVAANYHEAFKEHHFWALDVNEMMAANEMANMSMSKETIDIIFYSNPKMVVVDTKTGVEINDIMS
ncbi:unnamed protein product [Parnassius apollo]|uniref:(apollo) hypothetical protein n=1 Tax=Parnassius apollo TaxID=110799 RepID=A0A8S3YIB4_PARAO|nr:unnamed protein product [Parnassius apollo]